MINVASVVIDPRFTQVVTRIQRAETINSYGESVLTLTSTQITAVVTSGAKTGMMRFEDAQTYADTITLATTVRLNGPSVGYQADHIVWQGQTYAVALTSDYNAFGYTRATCKLVDVEDQPVA